jgi:hypothetical protein
MSTYSISVPERNSIDTLAEAREKRDAAVRARMSKVAYREDILQAMKDALEDPGHPLAELANQLFDAPIRDPFDARAFLEMRDGQRLGKSILALVVEASLAAYEEADTDGF